VCRDRTWGRLAAIGLAHLGTPRWSVHCPACVSGGYLAAIRVPERALRLVLAATIILVAGTCISRIAFVDLSIVRNFVPNAPLDEI